MIARAIPNAHVIASDNDPQMISLMKEAQDVPHNLMIQLVDMQNLDLYADESFDAVTCCYGIMFPPDKVKMFAEIHRVLKAGGTFLCTYWTNLRVNALREAIMQQVLQGPVPPRNVNPLYFKEPGLLENMLKDSNFGNFETIESSYDFSMGPTNDEETLRVILFTTVDQVDELQAWDTARNALEEHKTEYGDVDSSGNYVVRDNTFKLLVATKLLQR
jgi:SAM-dependent methyltransferase